MRLLTQLFTRRRHYDELSETIREHLEEKILDLMDEGMTRVNAERAARREFGNVALIEERGRVVWQWPMLESALADVRYALRQLSRSPGFAITAIAVLALGICSSVAIFAFVDAALIRPLPYKLPARLVGVYETTSLCPRCNVAYLNYLDWKKSDLPFSSLEVWGYTRYLLNGHDGAEPVPGARVSDGFFRTLGVVPILGRDFYPGEDKPGSPHTVLLSYGAWQKRFNGSPDVLGRPITLSDTSYSIIGVLPSEFQFAPRGATEFWTALNDPSSCEVRRACHSLFGLARLKDRISLQSALAEMKTIELRLAKQYPDANRGFSADVVKLTEVVAGDIRPILLVLLGGAGLLFLIACVNVSSLLVVRSESRKREIALRGALGASPARLVRQFVTEGFVLVLAGSLLGLTSAYFAVHLLIRLIPASVIDAMPYLAGLGLNLRVMTFAGLIALLAAILFSIVPALRWAREDLRGCLAEGGRASAAMLWRRLGSKLVVLELAIAMMLLVGAGLLGKSLYRLLHVDIGFEPDHVATLLITMPNSYQENAQVMRLERQLVNRIGSLPGVKSVGISTSLPSSSWGMATNILVSGRPSNGEHNTVPERDVSSEYLKTLGATLLRGRYFTEAEDDPSKPHVAVINQTFAQQYFPGDDPIGKRLLYEGSEEPIEIVGIVRDIKEGQLDTINRPVLYDPFSPLWFRSFNLVVRTFQAEQSLLPTLTATINQIDPGIATSDGGTMKDVIGGSQSSYLHRSSAFLVGGFAGAALILSIVGLYGVIAYSVSQRTREIGVRMALGAQRSSVYQMIFKEAGWLAAIGITTGIGCSLAATTLLRKLLFGTQPWDFLTFTTVAAVLVAFAFLASYIPARRAASINPVEALRTE